MDISKYRTSGGGEGGWLQHSCKISTRFLRVRLYQPCLSLVFIIPQLSSRKKSDRQKKKEFIQDGLCRGWIAKKFRFFVRGNIQPTAHESPNKGRAVFKLKGGKTTSPSPPFLVRSVKYGSCCVEGEPFYYYKLQLSNRRFYLINIQHSKFKFFYQPKNSH